VSHDHTQPDPRATRSGRGNGAGTSAGTGSSGSKAKRSWWRAPRRTWIKRVVWTVVGFLALGASAVAVAFATIQVPDVANGLAEAQTSIVYYDDGKTEMARIAELDREPLPLASMPKHRAARGHRRRGPRLLHQRGDLTHRHRPVDVAGRQAAATSRVAGRRSPSNT
jgi:hypothetical protein